MTEEAKDNFIPTAAPPPDWLQKAWAGAKRRGLGALTLDDINTEIDGDRRGAVPSGSGKEP